MQRGSSRLGPLVGVAVLFGLWMAVRDLSVERPACAGEMSLTAAGPIDGGGRPVSKVVVLGASWCDYCKQAARYFDARGVAFCEYDVETSPVGRRLYQEVGARGVPVFLIGEQRLYGYDEGRLRRQLSDAGWLSSG